MKRDNVNIILCEKIDSDLKNITNIFDVVKMDDNNNISFTAVVFINGIEWQVDEFVLYFFLVNVDENKMALLGASEFLNDKENKFRSNGSQEVSNHPNCGQSISHMQFEDIFVPEKGNYELQVYKYENEKAIDLSDEESTSGIEYAKDENLVCSYAFEVV